METNWSETTINPAKKKKRIELAWTHIEKK